MTLPKPKFCGQNWLDMKPTKNGRVCSGCNKVILDFSRKNFNEIEEIQRANNNSICGMYSKKRIDNWGLTSKNSKFPHKALLAFSTLIATSGQLVAQNSVKNNSSIETVTINNNNKQIQPLNQKDSIISTIEGLVTEFNKKGEKVPLKGVLVSLKVHNLTTFTNSEGMYKIKIPTSQYQPLKESMTIAMDEYQAQRIQFDSIPKGKTVFNTDLNTMISSSINFYVSEPTNWQKFKWRIKNLFSTKKP